MNNWQPWMGLMVTIYIADPDWTPEGNEQWWWAITLPDGTLRPAYSALSAMPKSSYFKSSIAIPTSND